MRRAARVDANHAAIVRALRQMGATVADTSGAGEGFPDLTVGWRGRTRLAEVKDGTKPPSKRKLTPAQVAFLASWRGEPVAVLTCVDDVLAWLD